MFFTWFTGGRDYSAGWEAAAVELSNSPIVLENEKAIVFVECLITSDRPFVPSVETQKETFALDSSLARDFETAPSDQKQEIQVFRKGGGRLSAKKPVTPFETSQKRAKQFLASRGGGLPDDAGLADVIEQNVRVSGKNTREVKEEFAVRRIFEYRHKVNGIEVAGGSHGDSIFVGVEDDTVASLKRVWHKPVEIKGKGQKVVSANAALQNILEVLPDYVSGNGSGKQYYTVTKIALKYVRCTSAASADILHPAWGFRIGRYTWVYIDAVTGQAIERVPKTGQGPNWWRRQNASGKRIQTFCETETVRMIFGMLRCYVIEIVREEKEMRTGMKFPTGLFFQLSGFDELWVEYGDEKKRILYSSGTLCFIVTPPNMPNQDKSCLFERGLSCVKKHLTVDSEPVTIAV